MKLWFDITNTPHVHFFAPIIRHLSEKHHDVVVTAREFSETIPLLNSYGIDFKLIGVHMGKNRIMKVIGLATRLVSILKEVPPFELSFGIGGQNTTPVSFFRRKPSIVFTDNDTSYKWHSYKLGSHFIFPTYFDVQKVIKKFGVKREQIHLYDGFKEDIYIANYKPDPKFLQKLPFDDFITIRPENLKASYVPVDAKTIVPELFEKFKNENILFLPRYEYEKEYAREYNNIFIPKGPLSGLDVCFNTKAMLTGAGTFAREAAILGTPSVSFFPGKNFLTVDKIMQDKGWEFKSRNPDEIFQYVQSAQKRPNQIDRCKAVQMELFSIIQNILNTYR
ncbi:MAG TPA: DUF354 domain-containing protein [Bacteroidia bacterium]|nr:DUF354 domain-containing protein [Bacteroidia bacterium]